MKLKGGFTTTDQRLDRIPQWDDRNREFPIRQLIGKPEIRTRSWRLTARLDQGQEGACVGFGWAHELQALPVYKRMNNEIARNIYKRAQQIDEWPGENYSGTSVLAGAKAVMEEDWLKEYRWAENAHDVLATLSVFGPVVIGVNWHEGMWDTDDAGYIAPRGQVVGGHCVVLRGVGQEPRRLGGRWYVLGRNSWGRDWGVQGDFKLLSIDLDKLLSAQGEACVPVLRG